MDIGTIWHWLLLSGNVQADEMNIPILVDVDPERTKAELEDLNLASCTVCLGKFPKEVNINLICTMRTTRDPSPISSCKICNFNPWGNWLHNA